MGCVLRQTFKGHLLSRNTLCSGQNRKPGLGQEETPLLLLVGVIFPVWDTGAAVCIAPSRGLVTYFDQSVRFWEMWEQTWRKFHKKPQKDPDWVTTIFVDLCAGDTVAWLDKLFNDSRGHLANFYEKLQPDWLEHCRLNTKCCTLWRQWENTRNSPRPLQPSLTPQTPTGVQFLQSSSLQGIKPWTRCVILHGMQLQTRKCFAFYFNLNFTNI